MAALVFATPQGDASHWDPMAHSSRTGMPAARAATPADNNGKECAEASSGVPGFNTYDSST